MSMKERMLASLLTMSMMMSTAPQALAADDAAADAAKAKAADSVTQTSTTDDAAFVQQDGETGSGDAEPGTSGSENGTDAGSGSESGDTGDITPAFDGKLDLTQGAITITATGYKQGDAAEETAYTGDYVITGEANNPITVESGDHNITLSGVNIDLSSATACAFTIASGTTTLHLADNSVNTLKSGWNNVNDADTGISYAGLWVQENAQVIITGDTGKLIATGGGARGSNLGNTALAAGIGASRTHDKNTTNTWKNRVGTITIDGGIIEAHGAADTGYGGAGIGGGSNNSAITINGGQVTATAGKTDGRGAAGIGSAYSQNGKKTITINDGIVIASGNSAGIGGGAYHDAGNIIINGGTVTATSTSNGAGIGGGGGNYAGDHMGVTGSITINGGTVIAKGSPYGAGIGGGGADKQAEKTTAGAQASGDITLTGGSIQAIGGNYAPGIGSGVMRDRNGQTAAEESGKMGTITISGGSVEAVNGDNFADEANAGTSYKVLDDSGLLNTASGIGQGYNASNVSQKEFETWTATNGNSEDIIAVKEFNSASVTYSRSGEDAVTVNGINGKTVLYLPEGYYTFDGQKELIAQKADQETADALVTKLQGIDKTATDFAQQVIDAEKIYNTFSAPLRYYIDQQAGQGHTIADLKKELETANVKVGVRFDLGYDTIESLPAQEVTYYGKADLGVPTRPNYNFTGWYLGDQQITDATGTTDNYPLLSEATLTAHWERAIKGSGTEKDPYQIVSADNLVSLSRISLGLATADDFDAYAYSIQDSKNATYKLMNAYYELENDITLSTEKGFYSIGNFYYDKDGGVHYNSFQGGFNGKGHTIHLDIDTSSLVSAVGSGDDSTTTLGHAVFANGNHAEIRGGVFTYGKDCTIKNVITDGSVKLATKSDAGAALIGTIYNNAGGTSTIDSCTNKATVEVGATFNVSTAGGLLGICSTGSLVMKNCLNTGKITAGVALTLSDGSTTTPCQGNSLAGGICGNTSAATVFTNCKNEGDIRSTRITDFAGRYSYAGGICSHANNDSITFINCENSGSITVDAPNNNLAGGLVCQVNKGATFTDCKNAGSVHAEGGRAGAIYGDTNPDDITLNNTSLVLSGTEKNTGWKLNNEDVTVNADNKLVVPITTAQNYYDSSRYVVDADGAKAADLFSADGSTVYNTLDNNANLLEDAYPFQSEADAYVVTTAEQYINLVKAIEGDEAAQKAVLGDRLSGATTDAKSIALAAAYVKINGDFTLSEANETGLGTAAIPFTGTVIGNNHTITYAIADVAFGLDKNDFIGLVANSSGAAVKDLNFKGSIGLAPTAENGDNIRIGAAVALGTTATIENCHSTVNIQINSNASVNNATMGMAYAGGLIGWLSADSTVTDCTYDGTISVTTPKDSRVGGIAGRYTGTMENVTATGSFTANEKYVAGVDRFGENSYAGGIAGSMNGTLKNAVAVGSVKATNDCTLSSTHAYAGGLVGMSDGLTVADSKALTTVEAAKTTSSTAALHRGGILGYDQATLSGTNWYLKTDDKTVAGATAIDVTKLNGHAYGDTDTMAVPDGVTLKASLASLNGDTLSFLKAGDDDTASLSYQGKTFYTGKFSVAAKALTASDVIVSGTSSSYKDADAAEDAMKDIKVVYGDKELVYGKDFTVTNDTENKKFEITFTGNYSGPADGSISVPYTIADNEDALVASATGVECTYDGKKHSITVGAPADATVKYGNAAGTYDQDSITKTNAGTYVIYWQATKDGQTVTGSAVISIAKAPLTIKADDKSMTVGGTRPDFTYTSTGLVDGESLTTAPDLVCSADGSVAGTYDIVPSGADAGTNYEITYANGTLTVSHRSSGSSSSGSSSTTNTVSASTTSNGKVTMDKSTAKKGDTVTITVTPDTGYELGKLTVTDSKGNTIATTKKGDNQYTFTMPDGKVTVTPTFTKIADEKPSNTGYVDVASSAWYNDAVQYVTDKGLMSGTGDNKFSPSASTTRSMLMTVLARYAGEDTSGSTPWYQKGMDWAKANGVSDGTNPTVNITREQLVTMLYRYAGSPAASGSLDSFSDASTVSTYAVNAMQWAVSNGIVNGSNGKLNPKNNATRAEVAAILMRFCEMNGK